MSDNGNDELLAELGRIMERRVGSVDERVSDLVVQVEIQLSRLRRDVARWVLWAALVSVVVVAGLCLAVVVVLV